MNKNLRNKIKEALAAVVPICGIVLLLHLTIAPLPGGTMALFGVGMLLLILGMGLFMLGADLSMMAMGERIGARLSESRNLLLLVAVSFAMGMFITIAEPDLQVLATQVPSVPNMTLILAVAFGVGVMLVFALLRIVFQFKLAHMLLVFYAIVFLFATSTPPGFLAVAFDSGGVTTGPITVPFILALGIGVAAVRGGKTAYEDSFGLVGICSVGPIIAVMLLGSTYQAAPGGDAAAVVSNPANAAELAGLFLYGFPHYLREVGLALAPIILFFIVFQMCSLKLPRSQLIKIAVGMVYTFLGLVLFLTGVNVGFMPAGNLLGATIANLPYNWVIIPIGMVIGFFVVAAEPAVHVLNKQVEELSGGAISRRTMMAGLSIGMSLSLGFAMTRVLTGIHIFWFLLPGYLLALALTFFVPGVFTAVAFDSGGVASGPMTATFLLPFAMGACGAVGGNILTDAFGIVAMVAMTPLVTIQILGLIYRLKTRGGTLQAPAEETGDAETVDIIEL
ncbi:DUF1538 domain-containing protein [Anaerotruncus rubiinfantis]|uniref:DUF1538 domain-containing protein n=1 Tax=Anaerotruncus rubiinfantis TaxID=1720200 RepID=UPI00082C2553|nr:DUF1538 domain-containing protein [Anaerotruncus rubiinfantis]